MNPIVYNKNGQFRFNDFVGYLPEFLKTEPDVVTLMQVMSDYINNAYRNIETTEEFELVRVCTSTDQGSVMASMERLCSMLQLASERGDRVRYLSVPRNNVKSNVIVGNEGAEYPREVEVDFDVVQDTIESASGHHLVDRNLKDGSVVYVKYRNAEPVRTIPYYYSYADDALVVDPAGTSQDPFTDTDNNPGTAIEFSVSDVGHVLRRHGGHPQGRSITYYEVFFSLKITDVKRVPATDTVYFDIDGVDKKADQVTVDYYNQLSPVSGNFNTFVKFASGNGFDWVGDYPSGIFYLRDTSGSKMSAVSSTNYIPQPDVALSPNVERYRVSRIEVDSNGQWKVYTGSASPGLYSDAIFYLMHGNEQVALLKMNSDIASGERKEDGELYSTLFPMSVNYSVDEIIGWVDDRSSALVLVLIPLSQSKYVVNTDDRMPMLKWRREYRFPSDVSFGLSNDVKLRSAFLVKNYVYSYIEDFSQSVYGLDAFYSMSPLDIGGKYYAIDAWDGLAEVVSCKYDRSSGKYIIGIDKLFNSVGSVPVSVTSPTVGYITGHLAKEPDSTGPNYYVVYGYRTFEKGDVLLVPCSIAGNIERRLFRVEDVKEHPDKNTSVIAMSHDASLVISANTPIEMVTESEEGVVTAIDHVRVLGDDTVAVVRRYSGSVFTPEYMVARMSGVSDFVLLEMDTDVVFYDPRRTHPDGAYVYKASDGKVYRVAKSTIYKDGVAVVQTDLVEDTLAHYSVGYKKVYNAFMPYVGPVAKLDYGETVDYESDSMSVLRLPLYVKRTNDTRLRYGWKEREYLYYGNDIGIDEMSRSGFVEFYDDLGDHNVVDVDLEKIAVSKVDEDTDGTVMKNGILPNYVIDIDSNLIAVKNADGKWVVTLVSAGHGLPDGARISVSNVQVSGDPQKEAIFNVTDVPVTVVSPDVVSYESDADVEGICFTGEVDTGAEKAMAVYHRPTRLNGDPLSEGDVVDVYRVENGVTVHRFFRAAIGAWEHVERDSVLTPFTLYAQQNLFDVGVTNPEIAMGPEFRVSRIVFVDSETAQVNLVGRIPETDLVKGTRVFIRYANNSVYNGWHTVTSDVNGGGIFNIRIEGPESLPDGLALVGKDMTLSVGMWYKYRVYAYDWSKLSNRATYVTSNRVVECTGAVVRTEYAHGLSAGDQVIVDRTGEAAYTYCGESTDDFLQRRVVSVPNDNTVVLDSPVELDNSAATLYRGFVADGNVGRLSGEYVWRGHRFREGEIVVTARQVCEDELIAWRVSANTAWVPMRRKRTFKIDRVEVDMVSNPMFDETDPVGESSEWMYRRYGEGEVLADIENGAYMQRVGLSRNYHFGQPHLDSLDTTRDVALQYSSKYDYGTVAPRDDMSSDFRGVPDMDYPLAERIERLAYLKDASVIDRKLIGYLARFMGYDITSLADDVSESGVYRTDEEREEALRETISHLPQYYALSGTKAGINMLMATFGLVGELVTLWTDADRPYERLVRQDEVMNKSIEDSTRWVPTPHVVLDVVDDPRFPSVSVTTEDVGRITEQVRVCKPINVVFDGIRVIMKAEATGNISIIGHGESGKYAIKPVFGATEVIESDVCMDDDCSF